MLEIPSSPERIEWARHHNREHNFTQLALMKRWMAKTGKTLDEWREQFAERFSELIGSDSYIRDLIISSFDAKSGSLPEEVLGEIEKRLYGAGVH